MPQHVLFEHMPARTSEHSPEYVAAFMIDDVSKHTPDLMPEQANIVSIHMSGRGCQYSLFAADDRWMNSGCLSQDNP